MSKIGNGKKIPETSYNPARNRAVNGGGAEHRLKQAGADKGFKGPEVRRVNKIDALNPTDAFTRNRPHARIPSLEQKGLYGGSNASTATTTTNQSATKKVVQSVSKAGRVAWKQEGFFARIISFLKTMKSWWTKLLSVGKKGGKGAAKKGMLKGGGKLIPLIGIILECTVGASEISASTGMHRYLPWHRKYSSLVDSYSSSSDPLEKLEYLRKMCLLIREQYNLSEERFNTALSMAKKVYQEESTNKQKIVASLIPIFMDFREISGGKSSILQDLCSAADLLIKEAKIAYDWNQKYVSALEQYQPYFREFENLSIAYARISGLINPSISNIVIELSKHQSGLS